MMAASSTFVTASPSNASALPIWQQILTAEDDATDGNSRQQIDEEENRLSAVILHHAFSTVSCLTNMQRKLLEMMPATQPNLSTEELKQGFSEGLL